MIVGNNSEYRMIHLWVERQLGRPSECENCGTTEAKIFHWANLSNEYRKDLSDWARLCVTCHHLIDDSLRKLFAKPRKTHCIRGHSLVPENIYTRPSGHWECKLCKQIKSKSPEMRLCRRQSYQRQKARNT